MSQKKPNFFIIGAPKCGTSSLSHYLSEHPGIVFSSPKEPNYWASDFPRLRQFHNVETSDKYLNLFAAANENTVAVGEGSTNYLRSETAIRDILEFNPNARFIVMIRNPVDVVYALHNTLLFAMNEDVQDFETAWRLQETRKQGKCIPTTCLAPQFLQYREMAAFPEQLRRFMAEVPEKQRMLILFDDFVADVGGTYRDVLRFLELADDHRKDFPVINDSKKPRFRLVHRILRRPPRWIERPIAGLRHYLFSRRGTLIGIIKRIFRAPKKRPALRPEFRQQLELEFRDSIAELEVIFSRNLSHWLKYSNAPESKTSSANMSPVS